MKVTRYPQSCLVLEDGGHKLVIDPGDDFTANHDVSELEGAEAVLYTHRHNDHLLPDIAEYLKGQGAALYGNDGCVQALGDADMQTVNDGDEFTAAEFAITARELPHCLMPDGSEGPQNTGYVINGIFFHPGDGKSLEGLSVDNLAMPINGPDVSMKDAFDFAKQVQAKVAIPIHYDKIGGNPEIYKMFAEGTSMPFEVRVLASGESTEI